MGGGEKGPIESSEGMLGHGCCLGMISALFGLASALGLGAADFMARFSARALGATLTYAAVLLIGALGTTIWLLVTGAELVWSPLGNAIAVAHGIAVAVMCILLYMGIAVPSPSWCRSLPLIPLSCSS
jgi:hypothetical protein